MFHVVHDRLRSYPMSNAAEQFGLRMDGRASSGSAGRRALRITAPVAAAAMAAVDALNDGCDRPLLVEMARHRKPPPAKPAGCSASGARPRGSRSSACRRSTGCAPASRPSRAGWATRCPRASSPRRTWPWHGCWRTSQSRVRFCARPLICSVPSFAWNVSAVTVEGQVAGDQRHPEQVEDLPQHRSGHGQAGAVGQPGVDRHDVGLALVQPQRGEHRHLRGLAEEVHRADQPGGARGFIVPTDGSAPFLTACFSVFRRRSRSAPSWPRGSAAAGRRRRS